MTTIEVEIPEQVKETFKIEKWPISTEKFLTKLEQAEEDMWIDIELDEPISMQEFSKMLKKDIYGS